MHPRHPSLQASALLLPAVIGALLLAPAVAASGPPLLASAAVVSAEDLAPAERRRAELWLFAARNWLRTGDYAQAETALDRLRADRLPPELRHRYQLYTTELRLGLGDLRGAEAAALAIPDDADPAVRADAGWLAARAASADGRIAAAISHLAARQALIGEAQVASDRSQREELDAIWELLTAAEPIAQPPAPFSDDPWAAGWWDLADAAWVAWDQPWGFRDALLSWRERHRDHPADRLLRGIYDEHEARLAYPRRIAVLLPLSGRYTGVGGAVRDGLVAAFEELPLSERPMLRFIDTADGAAGAYYAAEDWRAEAIVGPLLKDDVQTIYDLRPRTPVLALNTLPDDTRPRSDFFQFALAPEDEARQSAARILAETDAHAVALVPDDERGRRQLEAFREELEGGGGTLLSWQAFDPDAADYSTQIMRILGLDRGRLRHQRLVAVSGTALEFEPRRRQDVDAVFIVADARQGRLIRPQLRFHYATRIPVYATSAVHDDPDPLADRDMDGIIFLEMPWNASPSPRAAAVQEVLAATWPREAARRGDLYAMGFDAFRVLPLLINQEPPLSRPLPGATGRLSLAEDGVLRRELEWASFRRGELIDVPAPVSVARERRPR